MQLKKNSGTIKTILYFVHKEKVFKYLLVLLVLTLATGVIYTFVEYDQIIASYQKRHISPTSFDVILTSFYWAITTISTCGFGDLVPATNTGKTLSIIVIYLSIASVALFTANLASALTNIKLKEGRGFLDTIKSRNHFIICGWKNDMAQVINEILSASKELHPKNIVIIANLASDAIDMFQQQNPELSEVRIIRGEYFNETLLIKANVKDAAKILILADETGQSSMTEVDSKTLLTAMNLEKLAKNVYICAELLDLKFKKYLKTAHVDEIIYSNEYSRILIANAASSIGITKIMYDLLDVNNESFVTTLSFPEKFTGKTFNELRDYFHTKRRAILIGMLEQIGRYHDIKRLAIRDAQKTPDLPKLLDNLKNAKNIETNVPRLNPSDDYIITNRSLAIIIETREVIDG